MKTRHLLPRALQTHLPPKCKRRLLRPRAQCLWLTLAVTAGGAELCHGHDQGRPCCCAHLPTGPHALCSTGHALSEEISSFPLASSYCRAGPGGEHAPPAPPASLPPTPKAGRGPFGSSLCHAWQAALGSRLVTEERWSRPIWVHAARRPACHAPPCPSGRLELIALATGAPAPQPADGSK